MSDITSHEEKLPRNDATNWLHELARALEGDGPSEVRVGNKTVTLSPASTVEYGIDVEERSPMLGGHREELTLTLEWKLEEG